LAPAPIELEPPAPAEPRTFCFAPARKLAIGVDAKDSGATPVEDADGRWLYFATGRFYTASSSTSTAAIADHVRVRMRTASEPELDTLERLPSTGHQGSGYNSAMVIRGDGLEMFFSSTRPTRCWQDEEIWSSSRASNSEPWSRAQVIDAIGRLDGPADCREAASTHDSVDAPVLLKDQRTLLYFSHRAARFEIARRGTRDPGDTEFAFVTHTFRSELGYRIFSAQLSCDGDHIFYVRRPLGQENAPMEPRVVRIISLDPLELDEPSSLPDLPSGRAHQTGLTAISESADCKTLYLSDFNDLWITEPRSCTP
jgi:hypothetical protein